MLKLPREDFNFGVIDSSVRSAGVSRLALIGNSIEGDRKSWAPQRQASSFFSVSPQSKSVLDHHSCLWISSCCSYASHFCYGPGERRQIIKNGHETAHKLEEQGQRNLPQAAGSFKCPFFRETIYLPLVPKQRSELNVLINICSSAQNLETQVVNKFIVHPGWIIYTT